MSNPLHSCRPALRACHNCRRRRLRCDRSVPECTKCAKAGQKCLGYGQLYRWAEPLGSQKPPVAITVPAAPTCSSVHNSRDPQSFSVQVEHRLRGSPGITLADPVLQDLSPSSRRYLAYFSSRFCQDLVVHDSLGPGANPFRELIPMSGKYPCLQHIVIAVSAIHFSHGMRYAPYTSQHPCPIAIDALVDALCARQKAIRELLRVLARRQAGGDTLTPAEHDALLASILFHINFALIDSGRDGWRSHLNAAGRLLSAQSRDPLSCLASRSAESSLRKRYVLAPARDATKSLVPTLNLHPAHGDNSSSLLPTQLRACDYVQSETVAYYIWNSALESLASSSSSPSSSRTPDADMPMPDWDATNMFYILQRTEANSYHSCPAQLLHIVLRTSRLGRAIKAGGAGGPGTPTAEQTDLCLTLLREAQSFDVGAWAASVCARNMTVVQVVDELELDLRRHMAATYRASVCLYILLVAPGLAGEVRRRAAAAALPRTGHLVSAVLHHLTFIPMESPLFKYTTWAVFLTGVETALPARRRWVLERLRAMREMSPWGMITSAMDTLQDIWRLRDSAGFEQGTQQYCGGDKGGHTQERAASSAAGADDDWLARLRGLRIDCLIV